MGAEGGIKMYLGNSSFTYELFGQHVQFSVFIFQVLCVRQLKKTIHFLGWLVNYSGISALLNKCTAEFVVLTCYCCHCRSEDGW